ncbi:MAG: iron donor protein CyaY [Bryobacteraceae bacterium]
MDEKDFQTKADAALNSLFRRLSAAADRYDFEPDFNSGALSIEFETPKARFVVSPNTPVRQIWVSARSKSFKLDWDEEKHAFVLPETAQRLDELMASEISQQMGEQINL